jgi:hypothetical protein
MNLKFFSFSQKTLRKSRPYVSALKKQTRIQRAKKSLFMNENSAFMKSFWTGWQKEFDCESVANIEAVTRLPTYQLQTGFSNYVWSWTGLVKCQSYSLSSLPSTTPHLPSNTLCPLPLHLSFSIPLYHFMILGYLKTLFNVTIKYIYITYLKPGKPVTYKSLPYTTLNPLKTLSPLPSNTPPSIFQLSTYQPSTA